MSKGWELPKFEHKALRPRRHDVALVIPVWNEGERITSQLQDLQPFLDVLDIILADGGSTDGSTSLSALEELGVTSILITRERGLGTALRMGLAHALDNGYQNILTMGGNGKDGVQAIPRFVYRLQSGVDFVQGSRFVRGGESMNLPRERFLGIRYLVCPTLSLASGFRYTDPTNGFKGFNRKVLLDERLEPFREELGHFNFQFYLNYRIPRLGYRVEEIPVVRRYPDGEIPTKIIGISPRLRLVRELFATCLGLYNPAREMRKSLLEKLPELGVLATFFLLAFLMTPEVLNGQRPVTHDHAVHYSRIWYLLNTLLPSFRLWDWNFQWFAGYPTNYHYPFLGDLLVCAFHGLLLGKLPLGFSYGAVVVLVHFLEGFTLYRLGKAVGLRWVGFVGGLFFMTHLGGPMVGGWFWVHYTGVWPVSLSVSLSLIAFSFLPRFFENPTRKTATWMGLFWGLALLCHPLQQIHFMLMTALTLLSFLLLPRDGRGAFYRRMGLVVILALGLASVFMIPFFSASDFAERFVNAWGPLPKLSASVWEGKLFNGLWPPLGFAGFIGVLWLAFSTKPFFFTMGAASLILIATGSTTFFETFALSELSDKFDYVQFQRFQMLIKPYWCFGAAFVVVKSALYLWRRYRTYTETISSAIQWAHLAFVGVLTLGFLFAGLGDTFGKHSFFKMVNFKAERNVASLNNIVDWIREKEKEEPRFFRIAVFSKSDTGENHAMKELAIHVRSPVYDLGYTPAINFKYQSSDAQNPTLSLMSVRFFITNVPHPLIDNARMTLVEQVGEYKIYEYKGWASERFSLIGEGSATETQWGNRSLALNVAAGTRGKALFHVAHFDRWTASWNGKPVPIEPLQVSGNMKLMSVTLPDSGGGRVELTYGLKWPEYLGVCLTFLSLALLFWGFSRPRPRA